MSIDILTRDPAFSAVTFIVIDFEGTTPAGYRPEPIEVAALWLHVHDGKLNRDGSTFQAPRRWRPQGVWPLCPYRQPVSAAVWGQLSPRQPPEMPGSSSMS